MSNERRDVAAMFAGEPARSTDVPDRTAGIPGPPPAPRIAPPVEPIATAEPDLSPTQRAPTRPKPKKRPGEPERLTVPLAAGVYEQLSSAAEQSGLWIHEFLELALDRHDDTLRAKDGITRHRRRRGAPRLQNAQLRVSQPANKRLRQIASRHDVPLADVMRTLVDHALTDAAEDAQLDPLS